ncbi:23S rRNA pseudouridine(955/2504/2580) synthase RluC [Pleionea sediminis]|uniref:23S rRNA pseudouridine(955/2504/2580) synthase RluC n=1 Tax=Pleionea sediminis TaxID=2569479 RepID=UPI001FEA5869|nr:23S rRNA pseudouridine(955/2504/2580) synthase RluC [Pleionea sediminis]
MSKVQFVTIDADQAGQRIDNFLITFLKGVPKSRIYRILRKGEVRVNKKRVKPVYKIQAGDQVRVPPVEVSQSSEAPININLDKVQQLESQIIYESDHVIVINKPSGIAVHGGSGLSFGVIEALRQLRPEARYLELVHRLDRDTSGCLLIAKKRSALRYLHEQLRDKKLYKEYVALAVGRWPKSTQRVDAPLLKNTLKSGERIVKVDEAGKPSITDFKIERKYDGFTLVQAVPVTGRTHQIRVHAQFAGCPLVGDPKYGNSDIDRELNESFGFNRLFLHARKLKFREQRDSKPLVVSAEFDEPIEQLMKSLNNEAI